MTIDERIEKLTERHEALAESVQMITAQMAEQQARDAALREDLVRHQLAIMSAIQAYMETLTGGKDTPQ